MFSNFKKLFFFFLLEEEPFIRLFPQVSCFSSEVLSCFESHDCLSLHHFPNCLQRTVLSC